MTAPNIPLHDSVDPESIADMVEHHIQLDRLLPTLRILHTTWAASGESAQRAIGERCDGVGSESCDQETSAWNPRYTSMNYALARLAPAG